MNHEDWLKEGGKEHPTHIETLLKPEQQKRIRWVKDHCSDSFILDIGCNWGYILNEVNGKCGVDINCENIDKAQREFPTKPFLCADVIKGLPFSDKQYDTVIMAEILEHLDWEDVFQALTEGLRIASYNLLITLPIKQTDDCACCFKHRWIPD